MTRSLAAPSQRPAKPRLWLVRHAQPQVATGVCYGRLNLPADPAASRLAAAALHQAHPEPWAQARCSPLQRCEQFGLDLQALEPDLPLHADDRLTEIDFGTWEGQAWDSVGRAAIDAWTQNFAHYRPGGGEPLTSMLARVGAALCDARAAAWQSRSDVLWITHAGVVRCVAWLLACETRLPLSHEWTAPAPGYGAWMTFTLPSPEH